MINEKVQTTGSRLEKVLNYEEIDIEVFC